MADINPAYPVRELTQAQYNALTEKDSGTLYCIADTPKYQASGDRFLETQLMTIEAYEALPVYEDDVLYCITVPIPTDGLTDYFDCRIGLSLSSWKNQAGGNDIVFFGDPEIMEDGSLGLRDSAKDYGSLLSPYTENRTFYCIFKTEEFQAINNNVYILGASYADASSPTEGMWMTLCSNGYPQSSVMGISIDRFYVVYRSMILSDIYHIAAVRISRQNGGYKMALFIDGQYSGETISGLPYSDLIGIGTILYHDGSIGANKNVLKQIRALAVYSAAHSDAQIMEYSREIAKGHPLPVPDLFLLEIMGIRGSGGYMQFSEFSLYDANRQKIQISEWNCSCSNAYANPAESADNLIDGNPDTKMCVIYSGGVCTVRMYLVLPDGVKPAFYSITTGNDSPERDPVSWNLYYRTGSSELALVDSQTNANIPEERKTVSELFPIDTGRSE